MLTGVVAERAFDALFGDLISSGDATNVNPQEDRNAVAGPFGDLCRVHASVQPGRHARMTEIVQTACQGGADFVFRESCCGPAARFGRTRSRKAGRGRAQRRVGRRETRSSSQTSGIVRFRQLGSCWMVISASPSKRSGSLHCPSTASIQNSMGRSPVELVERRTGAGVVERGVHRKPPALGLR